jgi:Ricin-type beta-trefoil lectin domain-like
VAPDATVTPVVTSARGALVRRRPVGVRGRAATITVPAQSVTTFLITGARGVAANARLVRDGHVYRLRGVQSGKSLAPNAAASGAVLRTTHTSSAQQRWLIRRLSGGYSDRARYAIVTAAGDRELAVANGTVVLAPVEAAPSPAAQWILSSTGDGTFTVVNLASKRLLDVGGGATNDGAPVSAWLPNSADNQRWRVIDIRP